MPCSPARDSPIAGGRPVWCHSGIKSPACWPSALSRVSVPGLDASAGGTAVRRKNRTTRHWPVVLFFSGGVPARLSWSLLDFRTRFFWDKDFRFPADSPALGSPGILVQTSKWSVWGFAVLWPGQTLLIFFKSLFRVWKESGGLWCWRWEQASQNSCWAHPSAVGQLLMAF